MDENKLDKLKQIRYEIRDTCGNCTHASSFNGLEWGTCQSITYLHGKHSDSERQLSINRNGWCPNHEDDLMKFDSTWAELRQHG